MKWGKAALAVGSAGLLCGMVPAGTALAAPTAPERDKPVVILNGNLDARPGELVDIALDGVGHKAGSHGVTASSPAFHGPVRLRWHSDAYGSGWDALVALPMTDKPGWYRVNVAVGGRVVGHDQIQVVRSQRPSFAVRASDTVARPGERLWAGFDDLYPGETGRDFTVSSRALAKPVRLVHDKTTDFYNPRAFSARPQLPAGVKDGTYAFVLSGPHGVIKSVRLTVRAARPGDPDYRGVTRGPSFYAPGNGPGDGPDAKVRSGGRIGVVWRDRYPDAGEDERLVATSPAFTAPLKLRLDDSKGADGDDPRYIGVARVRTGLRPGSYPVTVVSHHGRVVKTRRLTVTAAPAAHGDAGRPTVTEMGVGAGALALGLTGVGLAVRNRRSTRTPHDA
ncbi:MULTISPECIES: hypothetical protein [Streptomycetaceae]|uniref:Uncharacterized protein n=1 Tax=Streptantibioticus cattleyicolor (strain ATCC 35852 / DSM 46488 / JCM 4925 / NBRC 14057 / NRRL 8057) TaxID=1003195 RepID=F8K2Z6_STREN|nr:MULTISPECIES: hypothetical protein [Streptomycetaceae]AEW92485.1 hypothetical protein SCATT_01140 [Streptantibioticus cattleyicolor NRRL 8057 = DSM 46488]MYS57288.1 hypothetical protein [Streptomyces sp. SID5468]CCB72845.1 exported protein of unknown function [Streptantibioticus cattleyicolor NRRL 8057 = DSM 46488]